MRRWKHYIETDVLTEAKARINHILDTHDDFMVSFSGGKDSLVVLHLTREVLLERGDDRPIKVWFYDEELLPDSVVDFVAEYAALPWIEMLWLAVPLESSKYILGSTRSYIQWDPKREHVRPKPEGALTEADFGLPEGQPLTQYDMSVLASRFVRGKAATLNGIRASESLVRLNSSLNKLHENYILNSGHPRMTFCRPIFDWEEDDVFRYFYDRGIRYCPIYDAQVIVGGGLRVSTPLHAEASKHLDKMRAVSPTFYDQVMDIFPEMAVQERYYAEFDRNAVIAGISTWQALREWIDANLQGRPRRMAMERYHAARKMHRRHPEVLPFYSIVKQFLSGAWKRQIQYISPEQAERLPRTPEETEMLKGRA